MEENNSASDLFNIETSLKKEENLNLFTINKQIEDSNWIIGEFDDPIKLIAGPEEEKEWENCFIKLDSGCSPSDFEFCKVNKLTPQENQKTPHSAKRLVSNNIFKQSKSSLNQEINRPVRRTPIPLLSWADSSEIWQNMIYKEEATLKSRNSDIFSDKTSYLIRMRAILLDWIMEVCEVYHLRRSTYHLAVDYVDRYLSIKPNVPKTQLQLLGVTCLFVAAKMEEIYPPKLSEFSYVCDGACTDQQILQCEVVLLKTLQWDVNPMTPTCWLNLYMQIHYNAKDLCAQSLHENVSYNFQFPQYSAYEFVQASNIIDSFTMDPEYLKYSYSIIAAAAMYFIFGKQVALLVSGLTWEALKPCVKYMSIINKSISESDDPRLHSLIQQETDERQLASFRSARKHTPNMISDESHLMQTHVIDLKFYETIVIRRLEKMGYIFPTPNLQHVENKTPSPKQKQLGDTSSSESAKLSSPIQNVLEEVQIDSDSSSSKGSIDVKSQSSCNEISEELYSEETDKESDIDILDFINSVETDKNSES